MMIARWHIEARFGHKQTVIDSMQKWCDEIGTQIGWTSDRTRIATGSIGVPEAVVELEIQLEDLAELNSSWAKLGSIDAHAAWSKEIEPFVVSGSTRWDVYRVV
jgi:hypothetical protein